MPRSKTPMLNFAESRPTHCPSHTHIYILFVRSALHIHHMVNDGWEAVVPSATKTTTVCSSFHRFSVFVYNRFVYFPSPIWVEYICVSARLGGWKKNELHKKKRMCLRRSLMVFHAKMYWQNVRKVFFFN